MSQIIPIYIPTFISDQNYNPSRVLPHLYFYNGLIDCETYWIESGSATFGGVTYQQNAFPYFDNYNVVTGSFPTVDSESLLFNNENAAYGEIPIESLYTQYWETYISLLYNPKTRLLTAEAIIPLADYFKMELNNVVNFKGNYYHLRAINDYSLKTGECTLQLLGPIIRDTISDLQPTPIPPVPPTGSTAPATASIKLAEYNASPTAFLDANLIVSGTAYYFSGDFTQSISGGAVANVVMEGKDGGSTVWGPYTTASATLTTLDNGTPVTSSTQYIYSGSGDTVITFPTTFTAGHNITISGSTAPVTGSAPPATGSADLDWSYSETGGANGTMDLYINGFAVESRSSTASGTYLVYPGDTIYVELQIVTPCGPGDTHANIEVNGNILTDQDCANNAGVSLTTSTYTVLSGDIGSTLTLNTFASCDGACL
jgi:hypothetical protein